MSHPRQSLYQRLPEIYHIRDEERYPASQLRAFMEVLDSVPAGMRDNIEALYQDFFIDTCADWVVPYLADLLGTSHLSGEPWTLRADVARTIFHRRRKGTLGAVESLAYTLSGWAAQAVELRNNLAWTQHLNHQRPDAGGKPPLLQRGALSAAVRGGTLPIRDPAALSFLDGAFDPFAHVADFKPGQIGAPHYNLPNLGIFLWRLQDYTVPVADPGLIEADDVANPEGDEAAAVVRGIVQPLGDPMVLFNTHRYRMGNNPPDLSHPDEVPGPIPWPRLNTGSEHGNPTAYVQINYYEPGTTPAEPGAGSPGLILHLPNTVIPPPPPEDPERDPELRWTFRGANLCAWEEGLSPKLRHYEIAIDPERGRLLFGLTDLSSEADVLAANLFVSYTYAFSGPTGAHPVSREPINHTAIHRGDSLEQALDDFINSNVPQVLEIQDSATYTLDIGLVSGAEQTDSHYYLPLTQSLTLRAASGQRPVIRLIRPFRIRPADLENFEEDDEENTLSVNLEGLYITWIRDIESGSEEDAETETFTNQATPLIAQAAVDLNIEGCTLDPGGAWQLDGSEQGIRQDRRPSFALSADYGLNEDELQNFTQVPKIKLVRSISGAVLTEGDAYELQITDSILDGYDDTALDNPVSIGPLLPSEAQPDDSDGANAAWGPKLNFKGLTCFGSTRVTGIDAEAENEGGIFLHSLQVLRHQEGCIRFSYFSGVDDRLPQHHGCVTGLEALIAFTDQRFGMPGYAQLRRRSDPRILEQGPGHDLMGAFGYLQNSHKWKNIGIRFREYMPVGIRPLLIPVT